jgi:hypothetical protein
MDNVQKPKDSERVFIFMHFLTLNNQQKGRIDHHEEIQTPTNLDIFTFYIWHQFSRRILMILQFLYLY